MVVWGLSAVLVVLVKQPGLVVALERLWLGVPFVGALLVISRRRLNRSILWRAVPGGILLCGDIALFFSAVKLTSIADATVIGALQPALVLLVAGPLFGERPRGADVAWTAVAIAGVSVVVLGAGGQVVTKRSGTFSLSVRFAVGPGTGWCPRGPGAGLSVPSATVGPAPAAGEYLAASSTPRR